MQFIASAFLTLFLNGELGLTTVDLDEDDLFGVTWRVAVHFCLWTFISCLAALPMHLVVEMPGIRLGQALDQALCARDQGDQGKDVEDAGKAGQS